jgi:hypothetical protein
MIRLKNYIIKETKIILKYLYNTIIIYLLIFQIFVILGSYVVFQNMFFFFFAALYRMLSNVGFVFYKPSLSLHVLICCNQITR